MTLEEKSSRVSDSNLGSVWTLRPGSFSALMALYESNYLRLDWLLDDMDFLKGDYISDTDSDFPLYLSVKEVCRYTTSIHLTYWFADEGPELIADPDLDIRIYHDARMAEVMSCRHNRRHKVLKQFDTNHGSELSRRWARNMMLNKWLEYCAGCKHRFRALVKEDECLRMSTRHE